MINILLRARCQTEEIFLDRAQRLMVIVLNGGAGKPMGLIMNDFFDFRVATAGQILTDEKFGVSDSRAR